MALEKKAAQTVIEAKVGGLGHLFAINCNQDKTEFYVIVVLEGEPAEIEDFTTYSEAEEYMRGRMYDFMDVV